MANSKQSVILLVTDNNNRFNIRVEPADHVNRDVISWSNYHRAKIIKGHKANICTPIGQYLMTNPAGLTQVEIGRVNEDYSTACKLTRTRRRAIGQQLKSLGMKPMSAE